MSTMLQISLAMIPAILLVLGSVLFRRKKPALRLVLLGLLVAVSLTCCVVHFVNRAEVVEQSRGDTRELVDMVYALLASGGTDEAEVFLKQVMETSVYVPEYALCQARIYVLRGDYTAAKMMYQKAVEEGLKGDDLQAEYDMVCRSFAPAGVDLSLLTHNPAYNQQTEGADQMIQDVANAKREAVVLVDQNLQQMVEGVNKHITESVQSIQMSEELYQRFLRDEVVDAGEVEAIIEQLNSLERKYPALMEQTILREARMKMQLTKGDFSGIAKSATERSGYRELMVISELYINGYITEKDFSKTYGKENMAAMRAVREHLLKLYTNEYREESSADRRQLKNYIDSLKFAIDNPALGQMQEDLKNYAQRYNAVDGSKVYMQLANLSYYQGNEMAADQHLSNSFQVVGNCQDADFTGPMFAVMDAINNKQDTESLKEVTYLVNQVMENATVMELHQAVRVPNPDQELPEGEAPKPGFDTYVSDYASQKRASISIVDLDASNFEEVVLEICVDGDLAYSAEDLRKVLQIKDCDAEIESFTVEEITYDQVNIILVCDVSGSMDGSPIESLRQTVKRFIAGKTDKERIGLVTFSSGVEEVYGLDVSVDELNAAVDRIYASGGTAIYDAMLYAVTMMGTDKDAMNVILLLSDGQDNYPGSQEEIRQNVCQPCADNGVVIYPIGLGSGVDSEYLARFATGTGGTYLYVNDDATLNSTYEYLHSLLSTRYRVTYKAVDTMTNDREVRVSIEGDELSYDLRQYSLGLEEDPTQQETMEDRFVTGLDTRVLFKTTGSQTVNLMVSGFKEEDKVSVKLMGDLDYDLTIKRISDTKYQLTIPSNIAVGVYDLQVKVNGGTVYLANELTVGIEQTTVRFGSYTFTSYIQKSDGHATVLAGDVCMNGWLHFKGAITLLGDLQRDATIIMRDEYGSSIIYQADHATGLAKFMAQIGLSAELPPLVNVELYDDDYLTVGAENYTVAPITVPVVYLARMYNFVDPVLYLYPDALKAEVKEINTTYPFQKELLSATDKNDPFKFNVDTAVTLTKDTVGLFVEVKLEKKDRENANNNAVAAKTGNIPLRIGLDKFGLTIDTIKSDYKIELLIELNFVKVKGFGLELAWGESNAPKIVPKEVKIHCDFQVVKVIGGIPVTFNEFNIGIQDLDTTKTPIHWTYVGGAKVTVANITDIIPKLKKYVGDVAVASLDDLTVTAKLSDFYIKMDTDITLFKDIKVGQAELECGKIPYSNALLNMKSTDIYGMRAKLKGGLFWKKEKCDVELSGAVEVVLSDKVFGAQVNGTCNVDVDWWVIRKAVDLQGTAFLGMYVDHTDDCIFTIRLTGRGAEKKRGINLSWSLRHGGDIDTKFY